MNTGTPTTDDYPFDFSFGVGYVLAFTFDFSYDYSYDYARYPTNDRMHVPINVPTSEALR